MAAEGTHVAINYRRTREDAAETDEMVHEAIATCQKEVARHGVNHILVQADVSNGNDVRSMVEETTERLGGVDILINNAGIQIAGDSHEIDVDTFDKVLAVNVRGAFLCAREAIQHFLAEEKPGVIVNISSVHQIIPKPRFIGYAVSKGGMQNLTRTLALEYAGRGIRVNAVGPGATITPINRSWIDDPEKKEMVESHIPMGRAGTAEEMAAVTAWLCCDDAAYITGQTLFVDGGLTLYPDFRAAWSSE
jgi:glucose 1-dehydrogenase